MDIEFHYYMTYLIAARATGDPSTAVLIAYACQYTDDNSVILEIDKGRATAYRNYISQTMNILQPKQKLMRIYPVFHFIPGDPLAPTAERRDGALHWLNTTPDSENARRVLGTALETGDPYRIGIACHGFADTWAHQNFIGYRSEFNAIRGVLEAATPNIGHADARHSPDWPALRWKDRRLLGNLARVDNTERFLDATGRLFEELRRWADPTCSRRTLRRHTLQLKQDLRTAIGGRDQDNSHRQERVERYKELAATKRYGGSELPEYDEDLWLSEAIDESVRGLRDRSDSKLIRFDPFRDRYQWRDRQRYRETHWFRFQEAVKAHQRDTLDILRETTGQHLALDVSTF